MVLSLGIVVAQWINLGTALLDPWGWRLSLALAGLPAIVLTVGGLLLPETPNSLIERGLVRSYFPLEFLDHPFLTGSIENCSIYLSLKKLLPQEVLYSRVQAPLNLKIAVHSSSVPAKLFLILHTIKNWSSNAKGCSKSVKF